MKPIKFKFRIEKISEHILQRDLKTIVTNSYYKLYQRVPWYYGFWHEIEPDVYYDYNTFTSIESAMNRAEEIVDCYRKNINKQKALKKYKKELKPIREIVAEFSYDIDV